MNVWRLLLLAAALAGIGGFVWWAIGPSPLVVPDWEIEAENPLLIGTAEDRFAYAGGEPVEPVAGTARIAQAPDEETPALHASISLPASQAWPWGEEPSENAETERVLQVTGYSHIEAWENVAIHGDSGLGDPRLPETYARMAGHGILSLGTGDRTEMEGLPVFWAIAQAIRQQDGGIRQQGLTFSPLLRDKRGFSDPDRWEFTILVYAPPEPSAESRDEENPPVLLQIVYRTLVIVPPDTSD